LTTGRVGTIGVVNKYREKSWTADNVLVIKSDYYDFAYQFLKGFRYEDIIKGGVQNLITQTDIKNAFCIVPNRDCLIEFERKANILSEDIRLHQQENTLLLELKSTLLGKMVI
jgi:type I restriction enzyme S subunit